MTISIDLKTGELVGADSDQPLTPAAIAAIQPPCPQCGVRVTTQPRPSDSFNEADQYFIGRHRFNCHCPWPAP